ncbi:MAG: ATP-binding cassette domain-containing protein, partial [Elsteraceae bacterium]
MLRLSGRAQPARPAAQPADHHRRAGTHDRRRVLGGRVTDQPVLEIDGLTVTVADRPLVEDLSLRIERGEMLGLVGESGCGKSITA